MSTDADCIHELSFRDRMVATKRKGRTCSKCGAHVSVELPVFGTILAHSPLILAVLIAIAWVDGGAGWFWLGVVVAAHVVVYAVEVKYRPLEEYDYAAYQEKTKRVRVQVILAIILFAALMLLFSSDEWRLR